MSCCAWLANEMNRIYETSASVPWIEIFKAMYEFTEESMGLEVEDDENKAKNE